MPYIQKNKKKPRSASDRKKERMRMYNSREWRELTAQYKMEHPLCERCLEKGITTPSNATHHIKSPFDRGLPEGEKMLRMYDINNLQALCVDCHAEVHEEERQKKKEMLDKRKKNLTIYKRD